MNVVLSVLFAGFSSAAAPIDLSREFHRGNCFAGEGVMALKSEFPSFDPAVSAEQRDGIWRRLEDAYGPSFETRGLRLEFRELDESSFGASTFQAPGRAVILVSRGTRYFQALNAEAYALMLCHEIGHHLGGAPVSSRAPWSSVEGQADYFSTADCWRRLSGSVSEGERAAFELTAIAASLKGLLMVNFTPESRDDSRAPALLETHPPPLCRWETFRRGLLQAPRPTCWLP